VVSAPREDRAVHVHDARSGESAKGWLSTEITTRAGHWSSYPITVARRVSRNFGPKLHGVDIVFASDLPPAAGLSSSSALIIATFLALAEANDLRSRVEYSGSITTQEDLAGYLGAVENGSKFGQLAGDRGVGTQGGSQDHTAILCARPGRLVQYAFAPVRFERQLSWPNDYVLVIASSGVVAAKTGNALDDYNRVAERASVAFDLWRRDTERRTRSLADMLTTSPDGIDEFRRIVAQWENLRFSSDSLIARVEQLRAELEIIRAVGDALERGDVAALGALIDRSQAHAERLLGNQVPETIALARTARELGAAAASAFGAGFGGSVYALVRASDAEAFRKTWAERYASEFSERQADTSFFTTRAGPPATRLLPQAGADAPS